MKTELLDLRNMDCMELMARYPDKHFDLAIVDPPYGIGKRLARENKNLSKRGRACELYKENPFDDEIPALEYFDELHRVSKERIIWGGNYFGLSPTRCFIFWDKVNDLPTMSDGEYAWTSFDGPARMVKVRKAGSEPIIHPTQKPVRLYNWLLDNYAKKGMNVLDTHMGSGSIAIACHYAQCHLTASELNEDYFKAACERIQRDTTQQALFA